MVSSAVAAFMFVVGNLVASGVVGVVFGLGVIGREYKKKVTNVG